MFLQGSYGNDTNIWADSDVDIVICLSSVYYYDIASLNDDEKARFEANRSPGQYSFQTFKSEVTAWLRENFGNSVLPGKKAIKVPASNSRRETDVLACVQNRDYYAYPASGQSSYHDGICFWTSSGDKIVNYPHQHMGNSTTKNGNTNNRFKPNARVLKNMRNAMIDAGYIGDGVAPSYFIEGMLYNVPDNHFSWTHQQTVEDVLAWLDRCTASDLLCTNERYYLVRDGSNVCWNNQDFSTTLTAMRLYWNSSGR
ncbi:nucleotidyltransferase [Phaeobacter sp. NW0010-22]